MPIKKPNVNMSGRNEVPMQESEFSALYPVLWEYLTSNWYADKSPRLTASLTIFVQGDVLKCCLNDRDLDRSAFFTGETVEKMLESVDRGIADDSCDWRRKAGSGKPSGQPPY